MVKQFFMRKISALLLAMVLILSMTAGFPQTAKADSDLSLVTIGSPVNGGIYYTGDSFAIRVKPSMIANTYVNYVLVQIFKDGEEVFFKSIPFYSLDAVKTAYTPSSAGTYTVKAAYSLDKDVMSTNTTSVKIKVKSPEDIEKIKPTIKAFRFSQKLTTLSWTYMDGFNVNIYRSASKSGTYSKIATVKKNSAEAKSAYYNDEGVSGKKPYYYKVQLTKKIGSKTYKTQFSAIAAAGVSGIPEIKSLTYTKAKGVKIVWTESSYADRYFVFRSGEFLTEVKAGKTFFYDKTAKPGKTYRYEVKAFNDKEERGKASLEKKIRI